MKSNSDFTRRKFITASLSGFVSAGLVGITPKIALAEKDSKEKDSSKAKIIYRKLGKTGIKLPIVSMGVMNANNPEIVQASYELGVRHFDTAANYQFGRNEQMVGRVINRLGVRDKVIIATKSMVREQRAELTPEQAKNRFIEAFEGSLKRLNMDYVDILYLHSVNTPDEINNPGIKEAMELFKKQKKTRAVGISTHQGMTEVINDVVKVGFYDVVLTSINVTMADDAALLGAIENAAKKGVGIIAMKTQAGGSRLPNAQSLRDTSNSTIATASLKWVMRNKNITTAIPGYTNFEHMKEDFSVARNLEYTTEEEKFLSGNSIKLSFGFCRQCKKCLASCPNGVDIPALMRTHMYAAQYSNFHHARAVLNEIPDANGLRACVSCTDCSAQCANYVDIPRKIDELKVIYA